MNKKSKKLLIEEQEKRKHQIIRNLLNDNIEDARNNLEWINLSDNLIETFRSSPKLLWYIIIGALCLFIIGMAWTKHRKTTQVSFEIVCTNVALELSQDWKLREDLREDIVSEKVNINYLDTILAPELGIRYIKEIGSNETPAILEMNGKDIKLNSLIIKQGTKLELISNKNELVFEAKDKPFVGELWVTNVEISPINKNDTNIQNYNLGEGNYETIEFVSSKSESDPVIIKITTDASWKFSEFRSSELMFKMEYPSNSGKSISTVKSGEVRILETEAIEEFREGDNFKLQDVEVRRLELSKTEEGIKVYFEGKVSAISVGPSGYEKNLAPTYLEYIYHQKKLAFFWSAIIFLWGFLWSFKNTIFGK